MGNAALAAPIFGSLGAMASIVLSGKIFEPKS